MRGPQLVLLSVRAVQILISATIWGKMLHAKIYDFGVSSCPSPYNGKKTCFKVPDHKGEKKEKRKKHAISYQIHQ